MDDDHCSPSHDTSREAKQLDPNAELWTAMEKMGGDGINQMPVMAGNDFVGMLSTGDIVKYLHTLQQVRP